MFCAVVVGGGFFEVMKLALATGRGDPPVRPWGDGLLEQSLSTRSCLADWSDVTEDDLIQYLPALASDRRGTVALLKPLLRAKIEQRTRALIDWLVPGTSGNQTEAARLVHGIAQGAGIELPLKPTSRRPRPSPSGWPQRPDCAEALLFELAIVIAIARLHARAAEQSLTLSLADALVASIHTRINAAYVVPEHAASHEILSMGAWLGVLLTGRSAIAPPAFRWVEDVAADDPARSILRHHAELAGVQPALRRLHATREGQVLIVPRRGATRACLTIWDGDLALKLRQFLATGRLDDEVKRLCRNM